MQTHVNEVTVIHTLVNTVRFFVVISKHGTGLVGHKGQIKKEDSALVRCIVGNWASERRRRSPRCNKAKENGDECHDAGVVYLINVAYSRAVTRRTVYHFCIMDSDLVIIFLLSNSIWH